MQTSMTGRPRTVTATVTKPKWMQIPNPDAMDKIRSRSVESTGSTESLTSLLDHDSYVSENDTENNIEDLGRTYSVKSTNDVKLQRKIHSSSSRKPIEYWESKPRSPSPSKTKSSNSSLSAWEQWVVLKAKEERKKKQEDRRKKREERTEQEKLEQDKQVKIKKAEIVRQQWTEMKDKERELQKKSEKNRRQTIKSQKEATEADIKMNSEQKFASWIAIKKHEEKQRRLKVKEENHKIKQHEESRKQMAEKKFQEWLKQAHKRPKTAPNSFGYLSGKMTGYHDRTAYPLPSFYNPMPWHPTAVPSSSQKADKPNKPKNKPYKWNPEKYF